uniref:TYR_PHOSPHATASE_2 domain-containing protein n=1 Tax=Parastrongyloides trichosuri TaxID=131310 RepID=A0A0N4ZBC6_PARTI
MNKHSYSFLRTGILKLTPDDMKCKLYCKGSLCKYCTSNQWNEKQMDINGLFSNWVTKNIIAMSRPTEAAIKEYHIIEQFKKKNIKTLINLQSLKEHNDCGPFLHSSGFSYDPEQFMREGIYYYNFPIPDYEMCSIQLIGNIVKVMHFSLNQGNMAIHCHAGLGRTGTVIAAYLIWYNKLRYDEAINLVRKNRPKSIQSEIQIMLLKKFDDVCHKYGILIPNTNKKSLNWLIENQMVMLPTTQCIKYGHILKPVYEICKRILKEIFEDQFFFDKKEEGPLYCNIGKIKVNWAPAFTNHGKATIAYIVNVMESMPIIFKDKETYDIIGKAQKINVITCDKDLDSYDIRELLICLEAYMMLLKTPVFSKDELIEMFTINDKNQLNYINVKQLTWICFIQYLCEVFSVITGEYYESFVSTLTNWLYGDDDDEVRYVIQKYMRNLFAEHLKEQKVVEDSGELNDEN